MDVSNLVKAEVAFDILREVRGIASRRDKPNFQTVLLELQLTWLPRVSHSEMRAERLDFVLVGFHLDDGAGGSGVPCQNDEALPNESE